MFQELILLFGYIVTFGILAGFITHVLMQLCFDFRGSNGLALIYFDFWGCLIGIVIGLVFGLRALIFFT